MYRAPTGGAIGGAGGLAMTGGDVSWWITLGVILVITGLLLMHSARRRKRASAE